MAYPLVVVEPDTAQVSVLPMVESDTVQVSVLPVAGCEFPAVYFGKVALDVIGPGTDRAFGSGIAPGWLDACARTVRAIGSGDCMDRWTFGGDANSGAIRAFGSRKASGWWITGGKIGRGLVCTTHHGPVIAFGSGDSFSMGAVGTFELCCD